MRIPYDALRMCESYTFPTLTDDATKTSTLEVQIWPYDDGRPESVTSVVESISKKQLKSCTEIKMAKATKCAKQLMAIQMAKLDKQLIPDKNKDKKDSKDSKNTKDSKDTKDSSVVVPPPLMSEKVCTLLRSMKSASLITKLLVVSIQSDAGAM